MEGPWINDAAALDTRYKFNGIERVQDFGLNMDLAMYRSYDPAIGRWWQIDPLAALAPEQTPYRFGFNSPMNFSDPFGLFETRKEAREYKRDKDVEGRVRRQEDGSFAIENKKEKSITFQYTDSDGHKSIITGLMKTERGVHYRDLSPEQIQDLNNPYSEGYNPDAYFKTNAIDILYYLGSGLSVASPSSKLASVSSVAKESDELITIYRGVNSSAGQAYENALKGIVKPRGGLWGHTNPYTHNKVAGGTVNSKFISWTLDKDVALNFAFRSNGSEGKGIGVLLEMKIHPARLTKSPELYETFLIHKGISVKETEVLLKGTYRNVFFQHVKWK